MSVNMIQEKVVFTEEDKIKIVSDITLLPDNDKYYILGFIQGKLLDKSVEKTETMTA